METKLFRSHILTRRRIFLNSNCSFIFASKEKDRSYQRCWLFAFWSLMPDYIGPWSQNVPGHFCIFTRGRLFFSTQIDNSSFLLHQNKSRKMPQFLNKTSLFVGQSTLKDIGKSLVSDILQPHFSLPVLEGSYWEVGRLFGKRWWSNEEMIPRSKANPTGFCFECNPLEQH